MQPHDFKSLYRDLAENVFRQPLASRDGIADSEISNGLDEIGGAIPRALRDYYSVLGAHPINRACNELFAPQELRRDDQEQFIIFMEENQSVCVWGFRIADAATDDPVVYQGIPKQKHWASEECTLSQFLVIMFYFQCTEGLAFTAVHMQADTVLPRIEETWDLAVDHNGLKVWIREGMLVSHLAGQRFCGAAASTKQAMHDLINEYGFEPD